MTEDDKTQYTHTAYEDTAIDGEFSLTDSADPTKYSKVALVDNMQTGSRNLLVGTKDFSKGIYAGNGVVVTNEIYNGNRVLYEPKLTDANSYHNPYNMSTSINADATVYTVSFYAKSDVNGMVTRCYFYSPTNTISSINSQGKSLRELDGLSEIILSDKWEKYWITWTTEPSDAIKHVILGRREKTVANSDIGGIYLTSPMFVEGDKPLPWSPAPEDAEYVDRSKQKLAVHPKTGADKIGAVGTKLVDLITSGFGNDVSIKLGDYKVYYIDTDGNKSDMVDVPAFTANPSVKPTAIKISQATMSLTEGGNKVLSATITPDTATDKSVTYTSSAPEVAKVSATGEVTAVAEGKADITVTSKMVPTITGKCVVTVTSAS